MKELLRSNDQVVISFVDALLNESGIAHSIADQHMSIMDGSIGALPRRVLVAEDDLVPAQRILRDAGLADELPAKS
jgi:hypothetical protein